MSISGLKGAGATVAGFLLLLALLAIPVMFLLGASKFSLWALEWIPGVIGLAVLTCVVLVPLAIIPATRGFAGNLFAAAAFAFGACLWLYALAFTYLEWGLAGVIIGVMLAGVGVVITGALAAILSATWVVLGNLAFLFALFVGARILRGWMAQLSSERRMRRAMRDEPSAAVVDYKP